MPRRKYPYEPPNVTHRFANGVVRDNLKGVQLPPELEEKWYTLLANAVVTLAEKQLAAEQKEKSKHPQE